MMVLKDIDDTYWCINEKKRTLDDIIGLVKVEGTAVESKKAIQNGLW